MSLMRQVGLLAAGCQPWNLDVCSASSTGERFAYCATLAVYIYELDQQFHEYKLISIMSEHKKTITSLCWHPSNNDILATAGADCRICIWNVTEEKTVAVLNSIKVVPTCIGWCPHEAEVIAYIYGRGPLYTWNHFSPGGGTVSKHLDSISFFSDICQFRWNMKKIGKIALGHADGSISVISPGNRPYKHYLRPDTVDDPDEEDPVTAIEWDPLSVDYLLVSNARHGVRMIDSNSMSVIMNFKLSSVAARIHTLAWIPSAPGMFVTGDTQTGALRVWNVSKSSPIANIKLKKTGFHALTVITSSGHSTSNGHIQTSVSSTSAASTLSSVPTINDFALPPAQILCTFLDGGVGLYDLGKRKWNFLREMGHVETIFDCKFKPEDPDLLATASFDGTIKVWNVNTMAAVETSPGNEGIIYALSWAPGDLNCIAGATAKQGVFIWDISKKKIIKKFTEHGKNSVYNVSWNHKDSQRIASCGSDGYCVIRRVDGSPIKRYKHPGAVYGCDWSLNNRDMLATGCEDKNVRVYYLPASTDMPLKVFTGHTAKVFHVKWSPLREGVLCSGSDDGTIRVWDYTQDFCVLLLEGHTAPIRGLLWNPEIPYLVLSGSWDYTIRVWDARDGTCLDVIRDHGADVYGLTCHRHRPFTIASCSRDSTLRIWSLGQLASSLQIGVLAQSPWSEIISQSLDEAMVVRSLPLLSGRMSRDLKVVIEKSLDNAHLTAIRLFSDFFMPPCGAKNLWGLVSVLTDEDESLLPASYSKGIMHSKHLVKYKASEAQEIETVKLSRLGSGLSTNSQDERLKDAANIHIRIGQLQRYCELMIELGQWDKALAIAPGVSMDYWKELIERRAEHLVREDDDAAIPYCVASGNTKQLVSFYTSRGQLHDAFLVAQVACEAGFPLLLDKNANKIPDLKRNDHMSPKIQSEMAKQYQSLLHSTSDTLADWYYSKGQCVQSACCHLSVGDVKLAMSKLVRGNELELAVSMGIVRGNIRGNSSLPRKMKATFIRGIYVLAMSKLVRGNELELAVSMGIVLQATKYPIMHRALELLSWKCEKLNKWREALNLLDLMPKNVEYLLALCAKCQGTPAEINELHEKAGFPCLEDCLQKAEELCEQEKFYDAMKYYLLSSSPELALDIGLNLARDAMVKQYWGLDDVLKIVQLLSCIRSDRLAQSRINKQRQELVALSTYVGALLAIRRQYNPIVYPLLKQARHLLHRDKIELGVPSLQIQAETEAWVAFNQPTNSLNKPTPEQTTVWERFSKRAGTQKDDLECGLDIATGSLLPSHFDVQQCYFTGEKIKGTAYALEDGKSSISLNHALMWAKVNAFSPLGTGTRFNPF